MKKFSLKKGNLSLFHIISTNKIIKEAKPLFKRINYIEKKGYFGELALIEDAPRIATVRCVENCYFGVLNRESFKKMIQELKINEIKKKATFFKSI